MITREQIEAQVTKSFAKMKFTPRSFQTPLVIDILDSFLNKGITNVVINCPTGGGKSVIGAVVSDALSALTSGVELASLVSVGTNILAQQYSESFSSLGKYEVFQIKGASNYSCRYMESQPLALDKTGEACLEKRLHPLEVERYCRGCEFSDAKKTINSTQMLVTNYTYFMINAMASNHLKPRLLHVFDEAHMLNEIFCSYTEIVVSVELIDKYIKELSEVNGKCVDQIASLVSLKEAVSSKKVHSENYKDVLGMVKTVYHEIYKILEIQSIGLEKEDMVLSAKYGKMCRKYMSLYQKIEDLITYNYDHVFDDSVPHTFSVKTIFVGASMEKLLAPYNLFMSATITKNFISQTLKLDSEVTKFIEVDPVFPKENKPLFFLGKRTLNYATMKDPSTIEEIKKQIQLIIEFHGKEKGLIMVPSFYVGSQIAWGLKGSARVFEHKSGANLPGLVEEFKRYKGASVLVSPSIFEGLDFTGDSSKYQIIVKSPFPSLGDKRIKYIADNYPTIYSEGTLLKILQGIGRSVRTPTDTAATYFLDESSEKLYKSSLNIWKSHYSVKT